MISNDIKRRFEEEKVSFKSFVHSNAKSAKVRIGAAEQGVLMKNICQFS